MSGNCTYNPTLDQDPPHVHALAHSTAPVHRTHVLPVRTHVGNTHMHARPVHTPFHASGFGSLKRLDSYACTYSIIQNMKCPRPCRTRVRMGRSAVVWLGLQSCCAGARLNVNRYYMYRYQLVRFWFNRFT